MFMYICAGFVPVMVNTPTGQSWEINSYKDSLNLEPGPVFRTVLEKIAAKASKKQKYRDQDDVVERCRKPSSQRKAAQADTRRWYHTARQV